MKFGFRGMTTFLKRSIWTIGNHAFLCLLALIVLALFISVLLFFFYVFPAQMRPSISSESVLKFRKDVFGQVIQTWKGQDERFQQARTLAPANIFRYNPNVMK